MGVAPWFPNGLIHYVFALDLLCFVLRVSLLISLHITEAGLGNYVQAHVHDDKYLDTLIKKRHVGPENDMQICERGWVPAGGGPHRASAVLSAIQPKVQTLIFVFFITS